MGRRKKSEIVTEDDLDEEADVEEDEKKLPRDEDDEEFDESEEEYDEDGVLIPKPLEPEPVPEDNGTKVQKITIQAVGKFEHLPPDVAGILMSCVKMNADNGRKTGQFYFHNLAVSYNYSERELQKPEHRIGKKMREKMDADEER
jgi:hypothetical protein